MRRTPTSLAKRSAAGLVATLLAALALQVCALPAHADAAPFPVLPADPLANFTEFKALPSTGSTQLLPVTGNPNFSQALQVSVPNGPVSAGLDGEYEISLGVADAAAVTTGDALVTTLWARSIQPADGVNGNAHVVFETDGSPFTKSMNAALQFGTGWQQFQFPFRAAVSYPAAGAHLNLWLGYGAQVFQIAGVSVTDYGPGNPAGYPAVTYAGRESNAAWRTAANTRIDQIRKGDLNVSVVNPDGTPVSGATVSVAEQSSAFKFGAASDGARLTGDPSGGLSASDLAHYQSLASTLFNQGTLGNNLKWSHWESQTERDADTYPALQWMRQHGLTVRGHNLVWPSWGDMPTDLQGKAGDPAALRSRIDNHITDEASSLAGIVNEWDVVNEPYSEHNVQDILGPDEINTWYQLAHQADPNARLALNDYGVLENGGNDGRHRDYDYNLLQSMKAAGAPVSVVGMESHFNGLQLTPPADLLPIVDKFAGLGLQVAITEFDVATDDQQLQADYTRDFMTAMFSDPNVTEISNFGIWANNIYNPLVALFNPDWSAKPNGAVWQNLIQHQWRTNTSGQTAANGRYGVRAFQGDYLVNVTVGGITKQVKVSMPSTAGASVTVVADGIATTPQPGISSPIGDGDFETGTQGWTPLGVASSSGTAASSTDAHSGGRALAVAPGTGVSQNVYGLAAGTSYTLSGWAKLTGSGTRCYIGVRGGATAGTPTFQYELNYGTETAYTNKLLAYTPPAGTTWNQFFVWANPNSTGASCHADDITLTPTTGTAPPAQGPPAITPQLPTVSTLGNGTLETQSNTTGWYCLGSCTLKNSASTPHSGAGDLSVSTREAAWAGPAQGVSVANGKLYDSSAWVRLASPGTDTATVSLKVTTSTGASTFRLGSATVNNTGWTQLAATNVPVTYTGTLQKAEWWISTGTSAGDLLVDDASFAPLAPVPASQPSGVDTTVFNPVQPTAACVVHNSGSNTYTAYFGYSNANNFYLPVPVGSSNQFSPGPADRGQTQFFLPYQRPKRFPVTWDGSPLTWQLNGFTQTASSTSPTC